MKQIVPIKKSESTTERVYNILKESIMALDPFKPGAMLSENTLAGKLRVSRTPVREALKRLEQDNLVQINPQQGTQVAKFSTKVLKEAAQLRYLLEIWAARKAINNLSGKDLEKMRILESNVEEGYQENDYVKLLKYDSKLHNVFLRAADNGMIVDTVYQANLQLHRLRILWHASGKLSRKPELKLHEELIDVLEKRDIILVEKFIEEHLNFEDFIDDMQKLWPEYFD